MSWGSSGAAAASRPTSPPGSPILASWHRDYTHPVRVPPSPSSLENPLWLPPQGGRCPGQGSRESGEGGATRRPEGRRRSSRPHLSQQRNPPPPPRSPARPPACSRFSLAAGGGRLRGCVPRAKGPPRGLGVPSRRRIAAPLTCAAAGRARAPAGTETGIGLLGRGRATVPRPHGHLAVARRQAQERCYQPLPILEHLLHLCLDPRQTVHGR